MADFRPRSNSEILDVAFEIYRRYFLVFMAISIFAAIPVTISAYISETALLLHNMNGIMTAGVVRLIGGLIAPFTEGAIALTASAAYLGEQVDLGRIIRTTFSHPLRLFFTMILFWILLFLGFALIIIPGLVIFKRYFSTLLAVVLEGRSGRDAMRRSRQLADGNGSRIFALVGGVMIFVLLMFVFLSQGIAAISNGTVGVVARLLLYAAVSPFSTIVITLLYYDIRIRKEGYDIELMTQALDVAPASLEHSL